MPPWALTAFKLLPTRLGSRAWGWANELALPEWARGPLLGAYSWAFNCKLDEVLHLFVCVFLFLRQSWFDLIDLAIFSHPDKMKSLGGTA
jgi:hypothetical protein